MGNNFWTNQTREITLIFKSRKVQSVTVKADLKQFVSISTILRLIGESENVEFVHENIFSKSCLIHFKDENGYMVIYECGKVLLQDFPSLEQCEAVARDLASLLSLIKN